MLNYYRNTNILNKMYGPVLCIQNRILAVYIYIQYVDDDQACIYMYMLKLYLHKRSWEMELYNYFTF